MIADAVDTEMKELLKEEEEMDQQRLKECRRCHSPLRSETIKYDANRPVVYYEDPTWCNICNTVYWRSEDVIADKLPNEDEGVLCKCQFPDCGKEFFNRPEWYKKQQRKAEKGNPWFPVLIDEDPERLKRLEEAETVKA